MIIRNGVSTWDLPQKSPDSRGISNTSGFELAFGTSNDLRFGPYVALRDRIYRSDLGFTALEDGFDHLSHILYVSSMGGKLVGGARLVPRTSCGLPLEHNGFRLTDHLSNEFIRQNVFAEVSRIAVEPHLRCPRLMADVFHHIRAYGTTLNISCVLTIAPRKLALMTRRFSRTIDSECQVVPNLVLGDESAYHHLGEMCLCVITLGSCQVATQGHQDVETL